MTDTALRDLLHERVDDLAMSDLSVSAWRAGQRVRRRRRLGAVAGVVVGTVAVATVIAVVDSTPTPAPTDPPSALSSPTPVSTQPDGTAEGSPVYWSPDLDQEDALAPPTVDGVLPTSIDLTEGAPDVGTNPVERATAAFAVSDKSRIDRLILVTPEGYRTLDVSSLDKLTKPDGYRLEATSDSMLSPAGEELLFPQDGYLMLYTLATGDWRRLDTGATSTVGAYWLDDDRIALPFGPEGPQSVDRTGGPLVRTYLFSMRTPAAVGEASGYGPVNSNHARTMTAQSFWYGAHVPVPPGAIGNPETVVVQRETGPSTILAIIGEPNSGRYKLCCPVVGWTDDQTLVYESRSGEPKLIGWSVGTDHFELVSRIVGLGTDEWYVASFADLS